MDPVTRKFLDNIRVHGFRIGYIQFALGNRAVVLLGEATPVERRGQSRINLEGGIKIGNRVLGHSALQIHQTAAVEGIDKIRSQPKRLVAIPQRRLQVADHGASPAAVIVGFHILGIEPQRIVEILDGKGVGPLAGIDLPAPIMRAASSGLSTSFSVRLLIVGSLAIDGGGKASLGC